MKSKCCGAEVEVPRLCGGCGKVYWTADGEPGRYGDKNKNYYEPLSPELRTRIELEALITEREGMIAKNKYREFNHEIQRYSESDFMVIADKIRGLLKGE